MKHVDTGREAMEKAQAEMTGELDREPNPALLETLGAKDDSDELELDGSLSRIMLLQYINSPFIKETDDDVEITLMDTARAVYVLSKGSEALTSLYKAERRRMRVKGLEKFADKNVAYFEKYMEKVDEIATDEHMFDLEAMEFFDGHFTVENLEDITLGINEMLNQGFAPLSTLPEEPEGVKKK